MIAGRCLHAHLESFVDNGQLLYVCRDCGKTFTTEGDAEEDAANGEEWTR